MESFGRGTILLNAWLGNEDDGFGVPVSHIMGVATSEANNTLYHSLHMYLT